MKNPFVTLGLTPGASQDEIKKAFKTLAKKYHPDVNPDPSAKDKFAEISEAYEQALNYNPQQHFKLDIDIDQIFKRSIRIRTPVFISLAEAHRGCNKVIYHSGQASSIHIPPGISEYSEINYSPAVNVTVLVRFNDPNFTWDEYGNVCLNYRIPAKEFSELNTIEVTNHIGVKYQINLRKNTDTQTLLRITKGGLYNKHRNAYGDLLVRLVVFKD